MKIYFFETAEDSPYVRVPIDKLDQFRPDPPRSLAPHWRIPDFDLVTHEGRRRFIAKTDFPTLVSEISIVSDRASRALRPVFEACGELLPIRLNNTDDEYFLFNVTAVINAVDMKQSKFFKLPSGAIGHCLKLVFDPVKVPSDALFFKNTQMGPVTEIYATEAAKEAVEQAGLTGYEFRLAWSNE